MATLWGPERRTVENIGAYQRAEQWQGFQTQGSRNRDERTKVFGGEVVLPHEPAAGHARARPRRLSLHRVDVGGSDDQKSGRVLQSLCREIRWDGARSAVAIVVVEEGRNGIAGWNRASTANAST